MGAYCSQSTKSIIETLAFPAPTVSYNENHENFLYVKNIACMMYENTSPIVIVYSHGNAVDIGQTHHFLKHLSIELNVNIISYDYIGYGLSRGKASELNCYESIRCVYDFLLSEGFRNENIIFYGTSVGTGPSVDLCSKINTCKGLLLQSPYTSIVGVQHKFLETSIDSSCSKENNPNIFRNIDKIHLINSRILILHGIQDSLINIRHSEELCAKSKNAKLLKLEHVGHNGIEDLHFDDIMKCLNALK